MSPLLTQAQSLSAAKKNKDQTNRTKVNASNAWDKERNANEPAKVKLFRASLLQCSCVFQLFDPWFMDANTKDGKDPEPNMQRPQPPGKKGPSNEELHAHHLHVSVYEPKILQG